MSTRDRIAPEKPTKSGRMRIPIPKPVPAPSDNEVKGKVVSAPFIDSKSDGNKQEPTKADGPSSASNGHGVKRERDSSTQWVNGQRYSHQRTSMNGGVSRGISHVCIFLVYHHDRWCRVLYTPQFGVERWLRMSVLCNLVSL